jgi:hypothetical protein
MFQAIKNPVPVPKFIPGVGVGDTGGKFSTGVVDTSSKVVAQVIDTGCAT